MPALRLSYHNLPIECRQCFAYCAIFEKDSRIEKDRLIHLWMATGCISSNGTMELEDNGNEIWNELYWRSFFQEVENDDFGKVQSFKMHDLVHDLAQSIMEDECHVERKNNTLNRSVRHLSVFHSKALENVKSLRTLYIKRFSHNIMKFSTLRVLNASETRTSKLPYSIGNLIHLRYLNLSGNHFRTLPESLCTLINLQTLNLNNCRCLLRLPKHMRRLTNLRHLFMEGCYDLRQMAPKIGQLTSLKTLSVFIVGRRRGFHLGEVGGLNIGGKLHIEHLERVKNRMDAREANLVRKQNLYSLGLRWEIESDESESSLSENAEGVLEALEPHPNLKELIIQGYPGTCFPLWMREIPAVLQNLVSVSLHGCKKCQNLPPFGQLLKLLNISGMKEVKYIVNDDSSHGASRKFPFLEMVMISKLACLERLSREEEKDVFPCLSRLVISDCPKLRLSCLPSLKDLKAIGCSDVLLSSISNLTCLTSLKIGKNDELLSFPEGMLRDLTALRNLEIWNFSKLVGILPNELSNLSALKSLDITSCGELESLPEQGLQGLNSLRSLRISSCGKLKSLSEGLQHLKALETLTVEGCPELVSLSEEGIKHLHSLRHLSIALDHNLVILWEALQHVPALQSLLISSNSELTSLPEWLGNLASLQRLTLWGCRKVVSLPDSIQSLTNLTSLEICGCGELPSLPEWLGNLASLQRLDIQFCRKVVSLPESIQNLTNLTTLSIGGCGEQLKRRCEKGTGEDWNKIQHIPDIDVRE